MTRSNTEVRIDRLGTVSLRLRGDIDRGTAPVVERHLARCVESLRAPQRAIVVDCSDVTFMDSHGLAALLAYGRRVRLVNPSHQIVRLLEML